MWLPACGGQDPQPRNEPTEKAQTELLSALIDWFDSVDQNDAELARVVALGDRAVFLLTATLERGPSDERRTSQRIELERLARDLEPASGPSAAETRRLQAFVDQELERHALRYQTRAAIALGRIGTAAALDALAAAKVAEPRVQRAIDRALRGRR